MNVLHVHRNAVQCKDSEDEIDGADFEALGASVEVMSKAEKDYQQLIIKKLKSAVDWDMHDAKMLKLG